MVYGLTPVDIKKSFIRYAVALEPKILSAWDETPPAHRYTVIVAVAIATLAEAVSQVLTENNEKWEQALKESGVIPR